MALREIAPGVHHLAVSIANVYFIDVAKGGWVLIDAGLPGKAEYIRRAAESRYGRGARPESILLTHGHFDHAGSARELAEGWNAPIYAHPLEMPYLTGKSPYPPGDPTAPGFMSFLMRFFGNVQGFNLGPSIRALEAGQEAPGLAGWEWLHTPGHAPGHISFFRRADATLIAGDAIATMNLDSFFAIATKAQRVSRPPTPITCDWKMARESVRMLASLKPFTIACGHGVPMTGAEATRQLAALAREFPTPRHGRYVLEPARTNENGIVYLPPKPADPLPKIAAGVGAAALTGVAAVVVARKLRG